MILELPNTTTADISRKIDELHEERGEAALGRVLTLLIAVDAAHLEEALSVANAASREHPCRVIAVVTDGRVNTDVSDHSSTLDAQIRFGADAGAGEIIALKPTAALTRHLDTLVIPLLVPDAPVVAWWPTRAPENPATDPIGRMARSRITDAMHAPNPEAAFTALRAHFSEQDVDLSWTRLTIWRALLATMLDQPPHLPITAARVVGPANDIPLELLVSWLALRLNVPVQVERDPEAKAVQGVFFERADGELALLRPRDDQATIRQPGQADQTMSMPARSLEDCLSEELRRLDPDEIYAETLIKGWPLIDHE